MISIQQSIGAVRIAANAQRDNNGEHEREIITENTQKRVKQNRKYAAYEKQMQYKNTAQQ